jgi:hypothetical protein
MEGVDMIPIEEEVDTSIEEATRRKDEVKEAIVLELHMRATSVKGAKRRATSLMIVPKTTIKITILADIRECLSPPSINLNS